MPTFWGVTDSVAVAVRILASRDAMCVLAGGLGDWGGGRSPPIGLVEAVGSATECMRRIFVLVRPVVGQAEVEVMRSEIRVLSRAFPDLGGVVVCCGWIEELGIPEGWKVLRGRDWFRWTVQPPAEEVEEALKDIRNKGVDGVFLPLVGKSGAEVRSVSKSQSKLCKSLGLIAIGDGEDNPCELLHVSSDLEGALLEWRVWDIETNLWKGYGVHRTESESLELLAANRLP